MPTRYKNYALANGKTLTLEYEAGAPEPSDADAEAEAKAHGVQLALAEPFDVKAQNATMRKNMDTQKDAATRPPESQWTAGRMVERGLQGLKGEAEGFAGGLAGLVAIPAVAYQAVRHPKDTAQNLLTAGAGAVQFGRSVAEDPAGAAESAKHALTQFGADPEAIGATAGGIGAMIAGARFPKTPLGKGVIAAVKSGAQRTPILSPMIRDGVQAYQKARAAKTMTSATPSIGKLAEAAIENEATVAAAAAPVESSLDAATLAQLKRQGYDEATIAQIEAASRPKLPITRAPIPDENLGQGSINLEGPNVVPDAEMPARTPSIGEHEVDAQVPFAQELQSGQIGPDGLPRAAVELAGEGNQNYMHSQFERHRSDALHNDLLARGMTPEEYAKFAERQAARKTGGLPPDADVTGEPNYDPSNPSPGPSAGGSLGEFGGDVPNAQPVGAYEESLLAQAGKPPSTPLTKVRASTTPSGSKRGPWSATPKYTVADIEGVGLDPKIRYAAFSPEIHERILQNRILREKTHRANAGYDAGLRKDFNRKIEEP